MIKLVDLIKENTRGRNRLKSISFVTSLVPLLIAAAQNKYDSWDQNDDGEDVELGGGGICQDIAEAIGSVLINKGVECVTVYATMGDQHVYCVAKLKEGVYEVDISPYRYERGGGYTWKKIPNVSFSEKDLIINRLDSNPNSFNQYTDKY